MRKTIIGAFAAAIVIMPVAMADDHMSKDAEEIKDTIMAGNAYTRKNLKGQPDVYSKDGSIEFWSSGGLMHKVDNDDDPGSYDSFDTDVKHIHVTTLVPGKAAVATYYSEGSMSPKGYPAVSNYRTRVMQVFVKEDGDWKVRAAHWSPIQGGSGTSQTALDD